MGLLNNKNGMGGFIKFTELKFFMQNKFAFMFKFYFELFFFTLLRKLESTWELMKK